MPKRRRYLEKPIPFIEDPYEIGPTLPDVVVTAPRKYVARYDKNGNPIYTTDKNLSMGATNIPMTQREKELKANRTAIKNRPKGEFSEWVKPIAQASELGIAAPLAPLVASHFAPYALEVGKDMVMNPAATAMGIAGSKVGGFVDNKLGVSNYLFNQAGRGLTNLSNMIEGRNDKYIPQQYSPLIGELAGGFAGGIPGSAIDESLIKPAASKYAPMAWNWGKMQGRRLYDYLAKQIAESQKMGIVDPMTARMMSATTPALGPSPVFRVKGSGENPFGKWKSYQTNNPVLEDYERAALENANKAVDAAMNRDIDGMVKALNSIDSGDFSDAAYDYAGFGGVNMYDNETILDRLRMASLARENGVIPGKTRLTDTQKDVFDALGMKVAKRYDPDATIDEILNDYGYQTFEDLVDKGSFNRLATFNKFYGSKLTDTQRNRLAKLIADREQAAADAFYAGNATQERPLGNIETEYNNYGTNDMTDMSWGLSGDDGSKLQDGTYLSDKLAQKLGRRPTGVEFKKARKGLRARAVDEMLDNTFKDAEIGQRFNLGHDAGRSTQSVPHSFRFGAKKIREGKASGQFVVGPDGKVKYVLYNSLGEKPLTDPITQALQNREIREFANAIGWQGDIPYIKEIGGEWYHPAEIITKLKHMLGGSITRKRSFK